MEEVRVLLIMRAAHVIKQFQKKSEIRQWEYKRFVLKNTALEQRRGSGEEGGFIHNGEFGVLLLLLSMESNKSKAACLDGL